ncbi:MAG: WD40 repeat domain-containing protein [Alphaproteobacteria bacterium]
MIDLDVKQSTLLARFGTSYCFDAFVTNVVFLDKNQVSYGLGDGTIRFIDIVTRQEFASVQTHYGACLSLSLAADRSAILSGGDDGRVMRTTAQHATLVTEIPGKWIEHLAVTPTGVLPSFQAIAAGKTVQILDDTCQTIATLDHPATVSGISFDAKGGRLAVAHYGGATIWRRDGRRWASSRLVWAGSHTGISFSPDGKYVVTTMQEPALHGWRLFDKTDMRMTGYPTKVKSMAWSAGGNYLITAGADRPVCWPFIGTKGPMGQKPRQVGRGLESLATKVAGHAYHPVIATGYKNGGILLDLIDREGTLSVRDPGDGGAITALDFSSDGLFLAFGTEDGMAGLLTLPQ